MTGKRRTKGIPSRGIPVDLGECGYVPKRKVLVLEWQRKDRALGRGKVNHRGLLSCPRFLEDLNQGSALVR